MTVNLGGGLTMSFTAHYSGGRTVVASKVPTWDNRKAHPGEAGHHAIFGVEDILISRPEASPRCIKAMKIRTIRGYSFQISPLLKTVRT